MNTIEEWKTEEGYRVRIKQDIDPMSPRDWDNLGTMACWHGRYQLGDIQPTEAPTEFLQDLPNGTVILPLYLYDHSGLTMSTSPFSCPWDSGQVGIIYVTPETMQQEMVDTVEAAQKILMSEVETYDQYLRGDTYYFVVETESTCSLGEKHYETIDGVGGYFGYEATVAEVESMWPRAK